ncbi:MAG: SGNH/GDSL hydrolase family protein [Deltaproteobacteria bacterium]|nr:SGNH/GDSL hydrolase family protein [Deltaproteobacteria bacterium]
MRMFALGLQFALLLAVALPATAAERALAPATGAELERVFAPLAPAVRLENAAIGQTAIDLELCAGGGGCDKFVLTDANAGCDGERSGSWCVNGAFHALGPQKPPILQALASVDEAKVFVNTIARRPTDPARPTAPEPPPVAPPRRASPWIALELLLGFWLAGFASGRLSPRPVHRAIASVALITPLGVTIWSLTVEPWLDLWDAALWALVLGAGLFAGLRHWTAGPLAAMTMGTLAGLVLVEIVVRGTLPPLPLTAPLGLPAMHAVDQETPSRLGRSWQWERFACGILFGDSRSGQRWEQALLAPDADGPRPTLHVGDSMLHGMSVRVEQTAAGLLLAKDGPGTHAAAAMPGTSLDSHLVATRRYLPTLRPRRVVLHAFPGNDLEELDVPLNCCGTEPLLRRDDPTLPSHCRPEGRAFEHDPLRMVLELSPTPYAVRALTPFSQAARRLRMAMRKPRPSRRKVEHQLHDYEATLRRWIEEVRAGGAEPVIAIMPYRDALEGRVRPDEGPMLLKRRLRKVAHELGVPLHDAWAFFDDIPAAERDALFVASDDFHLSEQGYATLTEWLAPRLARTTQPTKRTP